MQKIAFYTLGCKVNQYETEVMTENFTEAGYVPVNFSEYADIYVINTCSVTAIADRKSRNAINRAHKANPNAIIAVTGCYSQVSPSEIEKMGFAHIIIGNDEKSNIVEIVENFGNTPVTYVSDIMKCRSYNEIKSTAHRGKTRAFMKIEDGCDNYCSYCIIPYARGHVRSRLLDDIILEARTLISAGYKEIVLTGIHLTSYGRDLKNIDLSDVLLNLHEIDGLERIRLGSLELTDVLNKIADISEKLPRLCPHFHISLQSGCDNVLKSMRRRYSCSDYEEAVKKLKEKWENAAITTDIMVGFPGETDEDFKESMQFAEKIGFAKMHVFPYSKRPGTVAATMENQIPENIKKLRAAEMQKVADKCEESFYKSQIGKTLSVLFEQKNKNICRGHSENYMTVEVCGNDEILKKIINVKITDFKDGVLSGKINPPD